MAQAWRRGRRLRLAALGGVAATALMAMGPLTRSSASAQSLLPGGSWSGPYVGVHGGASWADQGGIARAGDLAWGGHAGYGLGLGMLYAGVEADATWGGARHMWHLDPLYASRLEVDWTATARGRLGVIAGSALLYGTAGIAFSGETIGQHRLGSEPATTTHRSSGLVIGAGVEMKLLPFLSARIEALSYDFSDRGAALAQKLPTGMQPPRAWQGDLGDTVVRAGINLRLN